METSILNSVKEYLQEKHKSHSIILYGSYASGDYSEESDIDLLCFCDDPIQENDTTTILEIPLDAWLYKTEKMGEIEKYLHIKGGAILVDERGLCTGFLKKIDDKFNEGPILMSYEKKMFYKEWLLKMNRRAAKNDIEGLFRHHWMLTDSLEIYFNIIGKWYLGPKKSFKWLYQNDLKAFKLFSNALGLNATSTMVCELIEHIANS